MSRIGKQPVEIPDGVTVDVDDQIIRVKGPQGELEREFSEVVTIRVEDGDVLVDRPDDSRQSRSHHGLTRSRISNMVEGVAEGFTRHLEIHGIGYRAEQRGRFIRFDLGYSHPIFFELPDQIDADVEQTEIALKSPDKELLGQVAAKIRSLRKPEPYKGKGIRYKDERIIRKVGKAGVKA